MSGHTVELVRPLGTEDVACPACGIAAVRSHRPARVDVIGPTVDTRHMYRRYSEASQELDYKATRIEDNIGHPIETPNYWAASKQRAKEMLKAGEPFRQLEGS